MQLDGHAEFLRPFIWNLVSGLMRFRVRQALGDEIMSHTRKIQTYRD
jgi:hypothetical protein